MQSSPRKIVSDCLATVVVLGLIFCLAGSVMLNGLADTINAIGAFGRWMIGS